MATQPTPPKLDWQALDTYKTPMDISWQFDYEIDIEKLRNLYSKAKQNQWDGEQKLDWSTEVDPSKPIVGEDRFIFLRIPFIQRLSRTQRETFVAHATAQLLSQFLHGEQGALMTAIAVTVDLHREREGKVTVEIIAHCEHKHEFIAADKDGDVSHAFGLAADRIKQQIKHHKEKLQDHRRDPSHNGGATA